MHLYSPRFLPWFPSAFPHMSVFLRHPYLLHPYLLHPDKYSTCIYTHTKGFTVLRAAGLTWRPIYHSLMMVEGTYFRFILNVCELGKRASKQIQVEPRHDVTQSRNRLLHTSRQHQLAHGSRPAAESTGSRRLCFCRSPISCLIVLPPSGWY